jgi:hypothetical protein
MTMPRTVDPASTATACGPGARSSDDWKRCSRWMNSRTQLGKTTSAYARSSNGVSCVQRRLPRGYEFSYTVRSCQSIRQVEARRHSSLSRRAQEPKLMRRIVVIATAHMQMRSAPLGFAPTSVTRKPACLGTRPKRVERAGAASCGPLPRVRARRVGVAALAAQGSERARDPGTARPLKSTSRRHREAKSFMPDRRSREPAMSNLPSSPA